MTHGPIKYCYMSCKNIYFGGEEPRGGLATPIEPRGWPKLPPVGLGLAPPPWLHGSLEENLPVKLLAYPQWSPIFL